MDHSPAHHSPVHRTPVHRAPARRDDAELAAVDVGALLRTGLGGSRDARRILFGDGAVAAALAADRAGVRPRSLTFLAAIVRSGGAAYAAALSDPLPSPEQTAMVRPWLLAARDRLAGDAALVDEDLARWIDAVTIILEVRQRHASGS